MASPRVFDSSPLPNKPSVGSNEAVSEFNTASITHTQLAFIAARNTVAYRQLYPLLHPLPKAPTPCASNLQFHQGAGKGHVEGYILQLASIPLYAQHHHIRRSENVCNRLNVSTTTSARAQ